MPSTRYKCDFLISRSWDELRARARQEVAKRWDAVRYQLGVSFKGDSQSSGLQGRPRFFFEPIDLSNLVALLQERLPQQAQEILGHADHICRHQFDLLGYEHLEFGPQVDWHLDIVHAKRAPLKPWFQIRYLSFQEVGDSKIIWELNRHQHLTTLAKAYLLTREQRFAEEIFRQWYDWLEHNPYPIGINWASSLEIAFRSLSWLWVRHLLETCPTTPSSFPNDLLRLLHISGRHIERYLSTYFSPNTHLLGEGLALFFIGTLCPQFSAAKRWQRRGWEIVLGEAARQVQADGMHFEQSTYYHVYAVDIFLHARILAAANQIPIPQAFDQILQKMLELLCGLSQAGVPPRLGDDDGGRLFDPHRNRAQHMLDPLAIGTVLFDRPEFKAHASLSEETVWLLGQKGVAQFDQLPTVMPTQRSAAFQTSGTYVMAGTEPTRHQAVIDAGRLGTGRGGHGHADALSLCLTVNNREWLVDAGTFAYVSDGMERDLFRGTAAHNTLRVDGVDQAEPSEPFSWCAQPEVRVECWIAAENFDVLVASHTGYSRLQDSVVHRRYVFYLKSRFWLVLDVAEGEGVHHLEVSWHLAPGSILGPTTSSGVCFVAEDQSALALLTAQDHDWARDISSGWSSAAYGEKEPNPVLRFQTNTQVPAEFATLLHPLPPNQRELGCLEKIKTEKDVKTVHGYAYRTPTEDHYIAFSDCSSRWDSGMCSSDAAFLYCCVTAQGSLRHIALSGGSFVEMDHRRVFSSRRRVSRFEWVREETGELTSCSDETAIDLLPQRGPLNQEVVLVGHAIAPSQQGAT